MVVIKAGGEPVGNANTVVTYLLEKQSNLRTSRRVM